MDTGVAIFTYNRMEHLKKVLEGLRRNELCHKVYIFQDKERNARDIVKCSQVKGVISSIDWMEYEYIAGEEHKGCAKSIEEGISYVLERHDAVIVLEDDCVPHPSFLRYMDLCLEKYAEDAKVIGVGGFAENTGIDSEKKTEDVYACGRTSSCGWGTWKARWKGYCRDYDVLRRIYSDREASRRLGIWGDDLEEMLCSTLMCRVDAWDVFWSLHAIETDKVFILPYKSLIQNIGFDGSGTHSTSDQLYGTECYEAEKKEFHLIENTDTTMEIEMAYAPIYNGYGHQHEYKGCKQVIVWGTGKYYRKNKRKFLQKYAVQAFIDKRKIQYFEGKPVIDCTMLEEYEYDFIMIMFANLTESGRMKKVLTDQYGISEDRIIIWTK